MGLGGSDNCSFVTIGPQAERPFELVQEGNAGGVEGAYDHCRRADDLELSIIDVGPEGYERVGGRDTVERLPQIGDDEPHGKHVAGNNPPRRAESEGVTQPRFRTTQGHR